MRQITLDTETTGLLYHEGHKIIEIGCIEIINRKITKNIFHKYINPKRKIDLSAKKITNLHENFLKTKPAFNEIINDFFAFIKNCDEIIIHNASFDINFINNELKFCKHKIKDLNRNFKIFDTLGFARKLHPGKKNNLDALCIRYNINNKIRNYHNALDDAKLLAQVYIEMTSKQESINFNKKKFNEIRIFRKKNIIKIKKAKIIDTKKHINYIKKVKEYNKKIQ